MARPRIGIALGSGSARGWSHIGILEALHNAGIEPDIVCGSSIGAFVGAAYVTDQLAALKDFALALTVREIVGLLDVRLTGGGLINGNQIIKLLHKLKIAGKIEACDKPFAAIATDLETGREVWREPWKTSYDINASAPIFHDGHLFLTSAYGTGCALFKLTPDGDTLKGEEVWRSKVIVNKFQQCILWDGALYCGDDQTLKCVEFMTGNELWKMPRMANATIILADKQLIVFSQEGKLMIAPVSSKEFKPTAEAQILANRCWTIPLLHDGKLYCRNLEKAVCVDISAAK